MITMIVVVIGLSCLSGLLYRMGGQGKPFNTLYRDCLVPACTLLTMGLLGVFNGIIITLSLIASAVGMGFALTTYRYFLPKPPEYGFIHYFLHGLFVSGAMVFYAWASGHWLGFAIRTTLCAFLVAIWSVKIKNDFWEEFMRGAIFNLTLPLLIV